MDFARFLGVDSDSDEKNLRSFSPLELLAELACHIPRVFEQTTRYFGAYSPRTRGARQREERFKTFLQNNFQPLDDSPSSKPPSLGWARSMKSVFELNPLLCPKCGAEMKIRSFILSSREIEQLCKKLGLISWRAPPPFKSSKRTDWSNQQDDPSWLDFSQDIPFDYSQIH